MLYELKSIRKARGITQEDMASRLSVPLSSYRNWEQLRVLPRDMDTVKAIADILGVSIEALYGYDLVEPGSLTKADEEDKYVFVPLFGKIAAGAPLYMDEVEDYFTIPAQLASRYPKAFLLEVEGESMNRVLPCGSYALIDPVEEVADGHAYALNINGCDATIKRVRRLAFGYELIPDSTDPTYKPKIFDYQVEGTDEIRIIGKVVWYIVPYDWEI